MSLLAKKVIRKLEKPINISSELIYDQPISEEKLKYISKEMYNYLAEKIYWILPERTMIREKLYNEL